MYAQIGGVSELEHIREIGNLRLSEEIEEHGSDATLEGSIFSWCNANRKTIERQSKQSRTSRKRTLSSDDSGSSSFPVGIYKPDSEHQKKVLTYEKIYKCLLLLCCVPLFSACETEYWLSNVALSYHDKSCPYYRKAIRKLERLLCFKSYEWFMKHYADPNVIPKFRAITSDPSDFYYDRDTSYTVVKKLLLHQYDDDETKVKKFIQHLYNVCEKVLPKKNTMMIVGPANAGKNYFIDCISAFYLCVGYQGNFNKNTSFPFQDCVNKRIIVWNEPNIQPSSFDTVKKILGGDPCSANIKYESSSTIPRTPVLITSNVDVLPNDKIFNTRLYRVKWKAASFLKEYSKYPHPYVWSDLINEYVDT